MKTIAIIPARGGSKRIPKKNIIDISGKPSIAWSIDAIVKSGIADRVLVSTDDMEIAAVSTHYGYESGLEYNICPFYRDDCCDDISTSSDATIHAIRQVKAKFDEDYDIVCQLMANCPNIQPETIKSAYDNFIHKDAAFQISCSEFVTGIPWWAIVVNKNGVGQPLFPFALKTRSQDLPVASCPTGSVWFAKVPSLIEERTFYGESHIFYPIPWEDAIDIDNYKDLKLARLIKAGG